MECEHCGELSARHHKALVGTTVGNEKSVLRNVEQEIIDDDD